MTTPWLAAREPSKVAAAEDRILVSGEWRGAGKRLARPAERVRSNVLMDAGFIYPPQIRLVS
jgi:hypothetical protein